MRNATRTEITIILAGCLAAACTGKAPVETGKPSATGVQEMVATIPATQTNQPGGAAKTVEVEQAEGSPTPRVTQALPTRLAPTVEATQRPTLMADEWMSLPVIPEVSDTARQIYLRGQTMGRDAHAFAKIGDCQSITTFFLASFDSPGLYRLGDYADLQETIDWYAGSFGRHSLAVRGGFNAAAILSPLRADPKQCNPDENPIACEIRLHNPSVVIISLEEWWSGQPEKYEAYMRQIIEYTIEQGVVPIVATKADNLEGNQLINQTIAQLAWEYDIPLWNFWRAVQPLPDHGLRPVTPDGEPDMFHLTHSANNYAFDSPPSRQSGWLMRNLTALQVLDAVRYGLNQQP